MSPLRYIFTPLVSLTELIVYSYRRLWSEELDIRDFGQRHNTSSMVPRVTTSDQIFHCILNFILAIACQRKAETTPSHEDTSHETFYARADRLLTEDVMRTGTLQLVQALVLKAMYLRGADMTIQSWISVGNAVRVAQAVGLQHEITTGSQAVREGRKRLWYACVLMDRYVFPRAPCHHH